MEIVGEITNVLLTAATEGGGDEGGSFLVSPSLGLMIWTLIAFIITMVVLGKFAFPKITEILEERASRVNEEIDAAERRRKEADELLSEYRERLKEAREQADDIIARARKAGEVAQAEAVASGRSKHDELVESARKDIEAETKRSLEQIRKEVADLTVLATEKVAKKSLTPDDQQRLVQEALQEVDFSALAGSAESGASGGSQN